MAPIADVFHLGILSLLICYLGPDVSASGSKRSTTGSGRPNVLMIIVDDLRPELGAYYDISRPKSMFSRIRTPSINSLASRSLLLKNAFVQQAICAPSRVSLLTSRRPDTTQVHTIEDRYWRNVSGELVTIPQFFKASGYRSVGIGKVFHHGPGSNHDDPPSWSEAYYSVPKESKVHYSDRLHSWRAVLPDERLDRPLPDDYVADRAVETIRALGAGPADPAVARKPFFVAVGFYKPHLPFVFPQQYLDLYPLDDVPVPRHSRVPLNMPDIAWNNWEIRKYPDVSGLGIPDAMGHRLPANVSRELRRAYYSAVSYVDDLIGRVLWQLEASGLGNNTIVALLGDHGWHLGEGNIWGKHTNFELSTRAPLMIRVPGLTDRGLVHEKPVEFVDIFPTLVEASGFDPLPVCPTDSARTPLCTEGSSLFDLMKTTTTASRSSVPDGRNRTPPRRTTRKGFAFSQYPRRGFSVMGYSIRTDRFRYTEWIRHVIRDRPPGDTPSRLRIVHAVELYDHRRDPDETVNVADDPSYARHQAQLSRALQAGWRWALTSDRISDAVGPVGQRVRRVTIRPPKSR